MLNVFYYYNMFLAFFYAATSFAFLHFTDVNYLTDAKAFLLAMLGGLLMSMRKKLTRTINILLLIGSFAVTMLPLLWIHESLGRFQVITSLFILLFFFVKNITPYDKESVRRTLRGTLIGLIVFVSAIAFVSKPDSPLPLETLLSYALIYLAAGILLLQIVRYENESADKHRYERNQIRFTFLFFISCILITVAKLPQLLLYAFYRFIFNPIWNLLASILSKTGKITLPDISYNIQKTVQDAFGDYVGDKTGVENNVVITPPPLNPPEANKYVMNQAAALIIFIIILALFVLGLLLLLPRKKAEKSLAVKEIIEDIEPSDIEIKKRKLDSPEQTIKKQYLLFMKKAHKKKPLVISDSTEDILLKYSGASVNSNASELTDIYRKLRYKESVMTKKDSSLAKKLCKDL